MSARPRTSSAGTGATALGLPRRVGLIFAPFLLSASLMGCGGEEITRLETTTISVPDPPSAAGAPPDRIAEGDSDSAPSPAPARRRVIRLTPSFVSDDPADPADVCFGAGPRRGTVASLTLAGVRYLQGIIQCGNEQQGWSAAEGLLRFTPGPELDGRRVIAVRGIFGIDEASTSQRGSRATFVVRSGATEICRVTVVWGAPASCGPSRRVRLVGAGLVIEQRVLPARSDRAIWAGVLRPALVIE